LGTPSGLISTTGVGGLALGGGIGYLTRSHGLTCDNILSAQVVTANGDVLTASQDENPDLFWGIKGGGGNFGVVSSFQFKLHEIGEGGKVGFCFLSFGSKSAKDVLKFYFDWAVVAPRNISAFCLLTRGSVDFTIVFNGKFEAMQEIIAPFLNLEPHYREIEEIPYSAVQSRYDSSNKPGKLYWSKSTLFRDIPNEQVIEHIVAHTDDQVIPTTIEIMHLGGAFADVEKTQTAFFHRDANFELHTITTIPEREDGQLFNNVAQWTNDFTKQLQPFSLNGGYVNIGVEGSNEQAFAGNVQRLKYLKGKYDPENVFHQNHNIPPP